MPGMNHQVVIHNNIEVSNRMWLPPKGLQYFTMEQISFSQGWELGVPLWLRKPPCRSLPLPLHPGIPSLPRHLRRRTPPTSPPRRRYRNSSGSPKSAVGVVGKPGLYRSKRPGGKNTLYCFIKELGSGKKHLRFRFFSGIASLLKSRAGSGWSNQWGKLQPPDCTMVHSGILECYTLPHLQVKNNHLTPKSEGFDMV